MLTLNLLPPEEKKKIQGIQAQRKILGLGGMGLIFILVFLTLLSSIWLFLAIQQNSAETIHQNIQADHQNASFQELENKIKQINERLSYAESLNEHPLSYPLALERLVALAPSEIKFTSLSFNQNKASLDGFAPVRQSLLVFKDALSQSPHFGSIDMPLTNFLKQADTDFIVNFEIK